MIDIIIDFIYNVETVIGSEWMEFFITVIIGFIGLILYDLFEYCRKMIK